MADLDWCGGRYLSEGKNPDRGLAVARMTAHITYLSEPALHRKFGRRLQDRNSLTFGFEADFQVESYLRHQGASFVQRFLDVAVAADLLGDAGDLGGDVDIAAVEGVEQAADRLLVIGDQLALHLPFFGVAEYIERAAAQAAQLREQFERREHPRPVFLLLQLALEIGRAHV